MGQSCRHVCYSVGLSLWITNPFSIMLRFWWSFGVIVCEYFYLKLVHLQFSNNELELLWSKIPNLSLNCKARLYQTYLLCKPRGCDDWSYSAVLKSLYLGMPAKPNLRVVQRSKTQNDIVWFCTSRVILLEIILN